MKNIQAVTNLGLSKCPTFLEKLPPFSDPFS